jgi:hypothetical protein
VYDDLELICRSGEKLEQFIAISENGINGNGTAKGNTRETAAERTARILRERDYEKSAEELAGYYDPVH